MPCAFFNWQEAIAVMVCENLNTTDLAITSHRAQPHYLVKGSSLKAFITELYGKVTGAVLLVAADR